MKRRIFFASDNIDFKLKQQEVHRTWLDAVAASHNQSIGALTYVFVSDDGLLEMNEQYLQHDTLTDIITFPMDSGDEPGLHGEVYISVDRVRENAAEFGVTFENELHRVMAHGLLHLCGFKDKSAKDIKAMRAAEDAALALFGNR